MSTLHRFNPAASARADRLVTRGPVSTTALALVYLFVVVVASGSAYFLGFQTALTILTFMGFAGAIVGLFNPGVGLIGLAVLATTDAVTRNLLLSGGLLRWNTLNYWLLVVILLNLPLMLRIKDIHSRLLQVFILLMAVELSYSPDVETGLEGLINVVPTFGLLIYFIRGMQDPDALYWQGVIAGALSGIMCGAYYAQITTLPYVNPNSFAYFPVTALFAICLAYTVGKEQKGRRLLLLGLAAINMVWIFLSASRGNMLTGLVCLAFLFIVTPGFSSRSLFVLAAIALGIWISFQFAEQQGNALWRLQKSLDPSYSVESRTSGRSYLAEGGLEIFRQNPFGVGTGGFERQFSSIDVFEREKPAHSAWIKVLAENGFPGFLILAAFVASFAIVGWQKREAGLLSLGLLVTLAFVSVFISKEFQGKGVWYLASGAIVMLHREEMLHFLRGIGFKRFEQKYNLVQEPEPGGSHE